MTQKGVEIRRCNLLCESRDGSDCLGTGARRVRKARREKEVFELGHEGQHAVFKDGQGHVRQREPQERKHGGVHGLARLGH